MTSEPFEKAGFILELIYTDYLHTQLSKYHIDFLQYVLVPAKLITRLSLRQSPVFLLYQHRGALASHEFLR